MSEPKVLGKQCRFALHIPAKDGLPDLHLVKEQVTYDDGTTKPNLRWIRDMKRSFWITQKPYQTHQQKKEVESLDRLMKFDCTQSELRDQIATALGMSYSRDQIRKLSNSPYLYGSEISSTAIIKNAYQRKNKTYITPYSTMHLDIETDMINGTYDPIIITAVFKNEIWVAVTQAFIEGIATPETKFLDKTKFYLSDFVKDLDQYQIHFKITTDTIDLIRKTFEWVHSKMPDWLAIWNMAFDIPKMLETCEKYNVDPKTIFCDPSIPEPARQCKFVYGLQKKKKANGQEVPIDYADQWHTFFNTASFYAIDAMCVYRLLRLAKQKDVSYSLDSILEKELGVRKLKFKEADTYVKDRWHIFMQSQYKIEYLCYAMFDSLSMKLLDEKILDLSVNFPAYAGITDFRKANSKPKMIADALHYYVLEKGYVLNSIGEDLESMQEASGDEEIEDDPEKDPETLSLRDWIMTLPAHLVVEGLPLIEEDPTLRTKIRAFVYDSDCVSAYPTATSILNVSKSTTKREIIAIDGIEEDVFRLQNINLCSGDVNALEYGATMFGLPRLTEW